MTQVLFDRLKSNLAQCINDGTIYFVTDSNGNFTKLALGDGSKSHVVGIGPKMDDATKQELMSKLGLTISSDMGTIQLGKLANHNGVSSQKVVTYERNGLGTDTHEISTVGYVQQYLKTAQAMVYAGVFNAQTKEVTDYNNAIISPSEEGNVTFDYLLNGNEGETLLTSGMSFIVGTAGNLEGYTGISVYGGETKVEVGDMILIINVQQKESEEGGSTYNEASILVIQNTNLKIADGAITTAKLADAAVTNEKLSTYIQSLISNLSKTATFAGIATPTTNPGTPNGLVFYIANGKGTYTNFGGIDVTEDEVVVLYYDTIWHKNTTGIASNDKLTELEKEVIYDVTANNSGTTFSSLFELLSSENLSTLIPISVRYGGMSIRFVQSSDNKYVQYRLMSTSWSTNVSDWQGLDFDLTPVPNDYFIIMDNNRKAILNLRTGLLVDEYGNIISTRFSVGGGEIANDALFIVDKNGKAIVSLISGISIDIKGRIQTKLFDSDSAFTNYTLDKSDIDLIFAKRQFIMPLKMIEKAVVDKNKRLVVSFNGDSIIGSQLDDIDHSEGYDTGVFPPNMSKNIMARMFLDRYQFENADVQYRNIIHSDWIKSSGAWQISQGKGESSKTFNEIEVYSTANVGDTAQITITGYKYFKLIWSEYDKNYSYKFQVLCSVNGGEFAPFDGINEYIEHNLSEFCMQKYAVVTLNPSNTYTFKVSAISNPEHILFWGCEYWNNPRLDVVVEAYSGSTANHQVNGMLASYCSSWHKPAFIISDVLEINDQSFIDNTVYTIDEWQKDNATIYNHCRENGVPLLLIVPHKLSEQWLVEAAQGVPLNFSLPLINIYKLMAENRIELSTIVNHADGLHLSNSGNEYYFEQVKKIFG